jgi:hypothetical protein
VAGGGSSLAVEGNNAAVVGGGRSTSLEAAHGARGRQNGAHFEPARCQSDCKPSPILGRKCTDLDMAAACGSFAVQLSVLVLGHTDTFVHPRSICASPLEMSLCYLAFFF